MREQAASIRAAFEEGDLSSVIPDPDPLIAQDEPMWETEKWW